MSELSFNMTGEEYLLALINKQNGTAHDLTTAILGAPMASVDEGYNTDIEVTFISQEPGESDAMVEFHYNRFDLGRMFGTKELVFPPLDSSAPSSWVDLISNHLAGEMDITIYQDDVIVEDRGNGNYLVKASPTSLRFIGVFSFTTQEIGQATEGNIGAVTVEQRAEAPVRLCNTVKDEIQGTATHALRLPNMGKRAVNQAVAQNGEIAVVSSILSAHPHVDPLAPDAAGKRWARVGDSDKWYIYIGFGLLGTPDRFSLEQLYDCTFEVKSLSTNSYIAFKLVRQDGKVYMIDTVNNTRFQVEYAEGTKNSQLHTYIDADFYRRLLGSTLERNAEGALLGDFQVTLKALRRYGNHPEVSLSYEVSVQK